MLSWGIVLALAGTSSASAPALRASPDIVRTVYVSATDRSGKQVTDLTASDLVVKENGQSRDVIDLIPATDPCHVAILVDDGGDGLMQMAVAALLNAAPARTLVSIRMLNPQAIVLNDYSSDPGVLQKSVNRLVQRGRLQRDPMILSDVVAAAAKEMRKRELSRPVIVALTNGGESTEREIAREILEDLRASGAALHVVHVVGVDFSAVMMDGPTQSGGSATVSTSTQGFAEAASVIAKTLAYQYRLTYRLPDGVRPSDRLQVSTTRPNVKVVAPTRIPTNRF